MQEGVTDASLQALAEAGSGKNLTSLHLQCECLFLVFSLPPPLQEATNRAGLQEGVTDACLQELAAAGRGTNLTSLRFYRECPYSLFSLLLC